MSIIMKKWKLMTGLCFQCHSYLRKPKTHYFSFLCMHETHYVLASYVLATKWVPLMSSHNDNKDNNHNEQNVSMLAEDEKTVETHICNRENNEKNPNTFNPTEHFKSIASILNCSEEKVKMLSVRNEFLTHLHPYLLQEKVQLMLSYGLSYSDILKNIRVCYKISSTLLNERLKLLHEKSLLNSNSARFLEGENKDFERAVEYMHDKKEALEGFSSLSEYIQYRLNCSESEAKNMLSSPPFTKGYTSIKLKTLIDFFLLEAKVSPRFLLEHPFLFTFSVNRLRHRLEIMAEARISDPLVMKSVWFYSTKKFNSRFQKFLKID